MDRACLSKGIDWSPADYRGPLTQIAILSAMLNVLTLGGSFFMLLVYDEVLPSRSMPTLVGLLLIITLVYFFQAVFDVIRSRAMIHFGATLDQRLADRVFQVITRYELREGPLREGGQPVRDLDQLRAFLAGPGPLAALDLPWVLLFLAILFLFHVLLGLLATVGALILVVLAIVNDRATRVRTAHATTIAATRYALAETGRRNAEVLQALGMGRRARDGWAEVSDRLLAANDGLAASSGGINSVSRTFRMLLQSLMLALGAALVINDRASGGIIIAGSILSARALAPIEIAIANWKGFVAARQAWSRLDRLLRIIPDDGDVMGLPPPTAELVVANLSAGPPGARKVSIGGVGFTLSAGDVLGIIGPSGAGKTSLVRALVGIWRPLKGAVRLDGASLEQWAADDLGRFLGYIPQDVELLDGTVAQNISRFEPAAGREAIIAAARAADVHDFIVHLPQGYDSALGPNGSNLSAGQRQRLALARALYRDPFLIVLDEPNSNLDREGEIALTKAIGNAAQRKAIVIVASHRPSALSQANRLLYIAGGTAQLFGPRDEVLAQLNARLQMRTPSPPAPAGDPIRKNDYAT